MLKFLLAVFLILTGFLGFNLFIEFSESENLFSEFEARMDPDEPILNLTFRVHDDVIWNDGESVFLTFIYKNKEIRVSKYEIVSYDRLRNEHVVVMSTNFTGGKIERITIENIETNRTNYSIRKNLLVQRPVKIIIENVSDVLWNEEEKHNIRLKWIMPYDILNEVEIFFNKERVFQGSILRERTTLLEDISLSDESNKIEVFYKGEFLLEKIMHLEKENIVENFQVYFQYVYDYKVPIIGNASFDLHENFQIETIEALTTKYLFEVKNLFLNGETLEFEMILQSEHPPVGYFDFAIEGILLNGDIMYDLKESIYFEIEDFNNQFFEIWFPHQRGEQEVFIDEGNDYLIINTEENILYVNLLFYNPTGTEIIKTVQLTENEKIGSLYEFYGLIEENENLSGHIIVVDYIHTGNAIREIGQHFIIKE